LKFWQDKSFWPSVRIVALVFLLLTALFVGYMYVKFNRMIDRFGSESTTNAEMNVDLSAKTILFLGLDHRKETGSMNTDVILLGAFHPQRKAVTLVSVPRDTYMAPAGFRTGKANSYYARIIRQGKEGFEPQIKKIYSDYFGVPIDYVLVFDFQAFSKTIDVLGGIDVNVDMDMRYVDNADGTNIDLRAGLQTLSGKQALDYVRYRKSNRGTQDSSDFARNVRQEEVISATLGKLKSIGGILRLGGVFDAMGNHVKSDIPAPEIRQMMKTYASLERANVQFIHLEGAWRSPYAYVLPEDVAQAAASLKAQLQ
jgi:LCP family protein required for cell wall assembly